MGKWLAMHTHTKRLPQPSKTYRKPESYGHNRHGNYIVNPKRHINPALARLITKRPPCTKAFTIRQTRITPPIP